MFKYLLVGLALSLMASQPVLSEELAVPAGPVVLEVSGNISKTNNGQLADFDLPMLEALAGRETTTTTPWYDGARSFRGPLAAELLKAVGAEGTVLRVTALNDYVTEIPVSDFLDNAVILATRLDGELMSVRDKGPIFVIYPFDEVPALNNETYYGRSAWQVRSIEVF